MIITALDKWLSDIAT